MNEDIKPFIKWVGGKRQLINQMKEFLPKEYNKYYEPFVGAGALLYYLKPENAVVNDMNKDLINVYKVIKNNVELLIKKLKKHQLNNCKEYYYEIRKWDRLPSYNYRSNITKAARFIYMNKVSFNGLYRVNNSGYFNVPYGRYVNPKICDEDLLRTVSRYFNENDITFISGDFEKAVENVTKGDFVYFDPPYDPISKTASFTEYNKDGFGQSEQKRLKRVADELVKRGAKVLLSNSNTEFINNLYSNKIEDSKSKVKYFIVELVDARRSINSNAEGRGKIKEVLIISKDL